MAQAGNAGPTLAQGCAIRATRLQSDGSCAIGASDMVVDDRPFVKLSAKPSIDSGVELNPKSACGALLISYKDYDREKRWDVTLDFGDFDPAKNEIIGGGSLQMSSSSSGRSFADGVTTLNSTVITSAALGAFVPTDVGRAVTGTGVGVGAFVVRVVSATSIIVSVASTASGTVTVTLGAIASRPTAYRYPALLSVPNPYGVAIEIWQKAFVRGTGYQGSTPYPSFGSWAEPDLDASAWVRYGVFRVLNLHHGDLNIENKESMTSFTGFAIENPNFGVGPVGDWTETAQSGGVPIDTTRWCTAMPDFQLPATLRPGYQTTTG